ncbi:hypothetical protein SKAU_G00297040 [Synaphobranchus kaupii]|uniref:Uncharacterized protein n=1 Tax=Synaphobranchus kaupii TaxID=118154 RepID=A0A9Q1EUZ4_SYNKA|nr:hypothetical protein SKAU_G00297040 [Synaphobranchus kaupii]
MGLNFLPTVSLTEHCKYVQLVLFHLDFEDVMFTVAFLLRKSPRAQFWTTYQERSADWSIEALLHKWNLECIDVPLESFQANAEHLAGSRLPGSHTVQMMIVSLKDS